MSIMRVLNEKNRCHWCTNEKFETDLDFDVVDDASGCFVHTKLIKFCPFCGRDLNAPYIIADDLVDVVKDEEDEIESSILRKFNSKSML